VSGYFKALGIGLLLALAVGAISYAVLTPGDQQIWAVAGGGACGILGSIIERKKS